MNNEHLKESSPPVAFPSDALHMLLFTLKHDSSVRARRAAISLLCSAVVRLWHAWHAALSATLASPSEKS